MSKTYPIQLSATPEEAGVRLDQILVAQLPDVSRVRVQQMVDEGKITVNGKAVKSSLRLKGSEEIAVLGPLNCLRSKPLPRTFR